MGRAVENPTRAEVHMSGQQYGFMPAKIVVVDVQRRSERAEETYGRGAQDTHERCRTQVRCAEEPGPLPVHYGDRQPEG